MNNIEYLGKIRSDTVEADALSDGIVAVLSHPTLRL